MNVRVRLFAILRERAGQGSIEVEVSDHATVEDAIEALARQPGLAQVMERMPVAMAVNREYADRDTRLQAGDELALVPPVSGGGPSRRGIEQNVRVTITDQAPSADDLSRAVGRPEAGAIVTFQGTTREVERLDYEAYREMAEERIEAILLTAVDRHGLAAAAAAHRIGPVPLGETSVIVAVSAPHRTEAFAGAREAIDRIKAEAPIWKRQVDAGQGRWVKGTPGPGASIAPVGEKTP
jgi:MoaE-MoaD fusion protein